MAELIRSFQQQISEAEQRELALRDIYVDSVKRYLKEEIDSANIPPKLIDCLAPSREICLDEVWSDLGKLMGSDNSRNYAIFYPWGRYATNVFSSGKNGVFAELTAEGDFRFYTPSYGPMRTDGYQPITELLQVDPPKETDPALLELQAIKFINFLKKGLLRLQDGVSPEGIPENARVVKTKVVF